MKWGISQLNLILRLVDLLEVIFNFWFIKPLQGPCQLFRASNSSNSWHKTWRDSRVSQISHFYCDFSSLCCIIPDSIWWMYLLSSRVIFTSQRSASRRQKSTLGQLWKANNLIKEKKAEATLTLSFSSLARLLLFFQQFSTFEANLGLTCHIIKYK